MKPNILILGASGFVGKHLTEFLINKHERVRAYTRSSSKITLKSDHMEIFEGDIFDKDALDLALEGIDIIYFLVHGMEQKHNFEDHEAEQAKALLKSLEPHHKVIYLSGLAPEDAELSKHMRSRHNVGEILRRSNAQIIELRASIVIGPGSTSFEMIRAIAHRFPFIVEANWSKALCQPIAVSDLLNYLHMSKTIEVDQNKIIEIGGKEQVEYVELIKTYAKVAGLKRPVLKIEKFPKDAVEVALEVFLPEYFEVGKKLLGSIQIPSIVTTKKDLGFTIQPIDVLTAMERAEDKSKQDWEELDAEELFNSAKAQDMKKAFGAVQLINNYEFFLPFKMDRVTKLIESFVKVYNMNPFKKFSLVEPRYSDNILSFRLKLDEKLNFKTSLRFNELEEVTKISMTSIYQPLGFLDASTFSAITQASNAIADRIKKYFH
jgi:uncharacterized protein YbjT (DUF2867 family)